MKLYQCTHSQSNNQIHRCQNRQPCIFLRQNAVHRRRNIFCTTDTASGQYTDERRQHHWNQDTLRDLQHQPTVSVMLTLHSLSNSN